MEIANERYEVLQIRAGHGSCTYTIINKTFKNFRYGALITLKDFFFLVTYEKAGQRTSKITTHCNTTFLTVERTIKEKKFFCKTNSAR